MNLLKSPFVYGHLNSITKYPSIPTYHAMGEKGRLLENQQVAFGDAPLVLTEKIDGTNARIIATGDDYLIGSREHLLHARGDRVWNPAQGIVEVVKPIGERLCEKVSVSEDIYVVYCEVFGSKIGAGSKAYTGHGAVGVRLFDVKRFASGTILDLLAKGADEIAALRDRDADGGQWESELGLPGWAMACHVPLAPRLDAPQPIPVGGVAETALWLAHVVPERSVARLDEDTKGGPEGVVVRTSDRRLIAKLRIEDYQKTLRTPAR